jgi:transposase-like protein
MAKHQRDQARERFWREAVSAWESSGLTVREFCRQRSVTEASFYSWRRELQRRDTQPALSSAPTFVPVSVIPAATLAVEVRCPSGHVVSLPNADAVTLRALFVALAAVPPC